MTSVAVLTDSNSGITQKQAEELGVYVVPMPFSIGENTYYEDINMSRKDFYKYLVEGVDISTSQPSPDAVMKMWNELLEKHDEVVYIPMSSGLSGSCSTAHALSLDEPYEDKVFVVDNQRISVTQRQSVLDAKELAECGKNASEIKQILTESKFESSIYIMVDTLTYLKKGGRITAAAAAIGTILKIKPVLQIQGEKLDAFAKVKTLKQAKQIMTKQMTKDLETRFGGIDAKKNALFIAHTENEKEAKKYKKELEKHFPDYDIYVDHLSLSISCHIGPGALAIACSKKIDCD